MESGDTKIGGLKIAIDEVDDDNCGLVFTRDEGIMSIWTASRYTCVKTYTRTSSGNSTEMATDLRQGDTIAFNRNTQSFGCC